MQSLFTRSTRLMSRMKDLREAVMEEIIKPIIPGRTRERRHQVSH